MGILIDFPVADGINLAAGSELEAEMPGFAGRGEVIQDGVHTAVKTDQGQSDPAHFVNEQVMLDELDLHQEVEQVSEVIREEAQGTDEQDHVDGPQGLLLVNAVLDLADPLGNEWVADQDDGKWDDKAKQQSTDIVGQHALGPAGHREVLKASSRVPCTVVVQGPPKDEGDRDACSSQPKHCDHYQVVGDFDPEVDEWVQYCNVTIHANAGEEGNAEVDVDVV